MRGVEWVGVSGRIEGAGVREWRGLWVRDMERGRGEGGGEGVGVRGGGG